MYEKHFGLTDRPFSIAPDPRFLYMSRKHREALAHLLYGIGDAGGFVQLTGEVGTGKTTICRCFLEQMPEHVDVALILNSRVTATELLASLCDELGIAYPEETDSIKTLIDRLNAHLLEAHGKGRRTVLIIDEAQNLSAEALEQIRLLTNLETSQAKLLQIILIGQPELRQLLAREDLRQLSQRITARYHLQPIQPDETATYIRHRLQVSGVSDTTVFSDDAVALVQKLSEGVPRLINVLCDRAMLGAFVEGKRSIDKRIVRKAAHEVLPEERFEEGTGQGGWPWFSAALVLAAAFTVGVGLYMAPLERWTIAAPIVAWLQPYALPLTDDGAATAPLEPRIDSVPSAAATESVLSADEESLPKIHETQAVDAVSLPSALATASDRAAAQAWRGLYRLWGLESSPGSAEEACAQAPSSGLRCLQGGGSWAVLQHYDLPAVLLLVGPEGRRVPALLQDVRGNSVTMQVDGVGLQVPQDELNAYWFGEYQLLWKMPPNGSAMLRAGDRSKDVQWLREQLQHATGSTSIAPDPWLFDAGLYQLLQTFQSERGLSADGVAGPRTFIVLGNQSRQQGIPRLAVFQPEKQF